MALVVKHPLAIIRDVTGRLHHFYRDAVLPSGLDEAHVAACLADGSVVDNGEKTEQPKLEEPTPVVTAPAAPPAPPAPPSK